VRSGTTVRRITWVTVDIGHARALASHWESRRIEWTLQLSRTVWSEVDGAVSKRAPGGVGNAHGEVVTIDQRYIIEIRSTILAQCPLCHAGRGDTGSGTRVTQEAAVTTTVKARVWPWVCSKVAVTTSPDAASLPIVGNIKRSR